MTDGVGVPIRTTGEKAWHSVYSVLGSLIELRIRFSVPMKS
jgi:hypothetical protein